ncbi:phage tail protein [Ciceribacter ferrooxidans]|uniref:Phage tail protein n=2 Tax=Ciceribacter ferrooxidans TaxID=2509717 RepID=A0A4Q2SX45_9HYPH|nr:phage tail protein [Ciceribacter ferrooxidans]
MLMQIGPVAFDLRFNLDGLTRETLRDYAEKPVVGAMPPLEDMGDGVERMALAGRLVPQKLGRLSSLDVLRNAQASGLPQLLVRGDGRVFGWYVIVRISDGHSYLDARGVGQMVDMTIDLAKAAQPGAEGYFSALWSILS